MRGLIGVRERMGIAVLRGNHKAEGIENAAQQTPLKPMARRIENVDPCTFVTGMSKRTMPALYLDEVPNDDMRKIPRESAALTSSSPLRKNDVLSRGTITVTDAFVLDE